MLPFSFSFRIVVSWLVCALPVLILSYTVVMVGVTILAALGDGTGAWVLRWIGLFIVMLFSMCGVSLLFLLGLDRLRQHDPDA
jgi:hypothetical protein